MPQKLMRGMALLQVLFLVMILMLMLGFLQWKAQQKVQLAQLAKDKAQALVDLQTAEADLLFTLLTEPKLSRDDNSITKVWNFHNTPFELGNTAVRVEDMTSRFSLTSPASLLPLLQRISPEQANTIVGALSDWQDNDEQVSFSGAETSSYQFPIEIRNGPVQLAYELKFLPGMNQTIYCELVKHTTLMPRKYFNAYLMPDERLRLLLEPVRAEEIIRLRHSNELTEALFLKLSGWKMTEDESFSPSNSLQLTFTASVNNVKLTRMMLLSLTPAAARPYAIWDYRKLYDPGSEQCSR